MHIDDAAAATVAAIESGTPGIFNVVDDAPAPASELVPGLAAAFGAPPPRRLPGWLVRLLAGGQMHSMMTRTRGASNEKAKRQLGWRPRHTFEQGLAETVQWYRDNGPWWERVRSGAYRDYYEKQYGTRLEA